MAATPQVTTFRAPLQVPRTPEISQTELALLLSLRNRQAALDEQVKDAERGIIRRLEAGAPVEPGSHVAKLEEHWRRNVAWKDVVVRLATRLGLDGQAYTQNVLGNTKPTRTVGLFVA